MMESPVIVENCANFATPVQTGFPFDDSDYDTHDHFEARLNDLAQRHPELADHLRFPSLRRKRYGSGSSQEQEESTPGASSSNSQFSSEGRRFADHSFPSGFNRFPFSRHFEEFANEPRRDDKPPEVPKAQDKRGRKPNPYLPQHLSNTVDLGQKQSPVEEKRSQRSMSAPPENRSAQNVTSARAHAEPLNAQHQQYQPQQHQGPDADMGKSFSKQGQPEPQPARGRERIIPIHVEGRDDPVIPTNTRSSATPERVFGGERVHVPGFQQYTHPRQHQSHFPKHGIYESFGDPAPTAKHYQQQAPFTKQTAPPTQQAHAREPSPAPPTAQPHHHQQQQQQRGPSPQPQAHHTTPPPPPVVNDPLEKIKSIRNDVMELMNQVEKFAGTKKDRQYIYLDEMLTRNLLKLDNIETEGKENIRLARKEAIKCIQTCINKLEAQAQEMERKNSAESTQENKGEMETDVSVETARVEHENTQIEQDTKKGAEEVVNKPVFKSEATLVLGGAPAGGDDDKASQAEMEQVLMELVASPAPADQSVTSMATEPVVVPSESTPASDVPADSAQTQTPADSTTPDSRPQEAPSSQPNEAAAPQE